MRTLTDIIHVLPDDGLDENVRQLKNGLYVNEIMRTSKEDGMTRRGTRTGRVEAAGPKCTLKPGDRIAYYMGVYEPVLMADGVLRHVLHEAEVMALIDVGEDMASAE